MAKREVELIIKARDQAKAAVDGIVGSLNDLAKAQSGLGKSGNVANSAIGKLSTELKNLQANAAGLTSLNKLANNFDRATKNVTRMESELAGTQQRLTETGLRAAATAGQFAELESATRQAGAALKRSQADLASARAEQAALNTQVAQAKERYQQLVTALRAQKGASDAARDAVRQQANTLVALIEAQSRQTAAVQQQQAAVRAAGQAFSSLSGQASTAERDLARVTEQFGKLSTAATQEADAVREAQEALGEVKDAATSAATALGGVEVKQEQIAAESTRVAAAIEKVSAALLRQQAAVQAATRSGATADAPTNAFKAQELAVNQARTAFQAASAELKRLKTEMAAAEKPTAALSAELLAARVNAQAAGQEWRNQSQTLAALAIKLREAAAAEKAKIAADKEAEVAAAANARVLKEQEAAQNRLSLVARILGRDVRSLAGTMASLGPASRQAANGIAATTDQSRRALSIFQRLRGQVLGLTTSFVGFYAGITAIGGVISALRSVEAAQSRLNAVFDGDQNKVRQELRFISQEADRLGLSFQVLSQEYGRFAIATNAANFSADATRKIFVSVAEAARVNKVSTEELQGTFLALQQIVSKGSVSMEELRGQLGERLPGAFNIFADALGVTTAELDKMIRRGEVAASEETLLKFADELTDRFGGALPASLATVTTEIDRFTNNLFEAQQRVAEGGFADALQQALKVLNEGFKSREGRDFFLQTGAALGTLVNVLQFAAENFGTFITFAKALIALKIAPYIVGVATAMRAAAVNSALLATDMALLDAAQQKQVLTAAASANGTLAMGAAFRLVSVAAATAATTILRTGVSSAATATAVRALGTALGVMGATAIAAVRALAPLALAFTAITLLTDAFGLFGANVPDATSALDEHTRQVTSYTAEAQEAERAGRAFNATLVDSDVLRARKNLDDLANEYSKLRDEAEKTANDLLANFQRINKGVLGDEQAQAISKLAVQFNQGKLTINEFQQEIRKISEDLNGPAANAVQKFASELIGMTDRAGEVEQAMGRQAIITKQLGDTTIDIDRTIERLGLSYDKTTGKINDATDALAEQRRVASQAATALSEVENFLPALAQARERDAKRQKLNDAGAKSLLGIQDPAEVKRRLDLIAAARAQLEKEFAAEDARAAKKEKPPKDPQAEFNAELQRTIDLRRFEQTLVGKSLRDQEIERAIFEAKARAQENNVKFSAEQEKALRESTGALFDATQAEELRNKVLDAQLELRKAMGEQIGIQEQVEALARQNNIDLLSKEGQAWADVTAKILEREAAEQKLKDAVEDVRALERQRQEALEEFNKLSKGGALTEEETKGRVAALEEMRVKILAAKDEALALARALGDEKAIAALTRVNVELSETQLQLLEIKESIRDAFASGAVDAIMQTGAALGNAILEGERWEKTFRNIRDAFLSFAGDFLVKIAEMIAQQAVLNAIAQTPIGGLLDGAAGMVAALNPAATAAAAQITTALTVAGTTAATAVTASGTAAATGLTVAGTTVGTGLTTVGATVGAAIISAGAAAAAAIAAAAAASSVAGVLHTGGIAGAQGNAKRSLPMSIFAGAKKFHNGGLPGLKRNEVATVLEKGEEVITEDNPRHVRNGGGMGGGAPLKAVINNFVDAADFMQAGLNTPLGTQVFMNFIRDNKTAVNGALR